MDFAIGSSEQFKSTNDKSVEMSFDATPRLGMPGVSFLNLLPLISKIRWYRKRNPIDADGLSQCRKPARENDQSKEENSCHGKLLVKNVA
jgi:hypothetical protein